MEDEDQRTYLRDQHLVRLFNKTLGLNLSSNCKGLDFYGISYKPVIYHDPQNRYEKMLSQPVIEQNRTETVKLSFNSRQVSTGYLFVGEEGFNIGYISCDKAMCENYGIWQQ
jgi:hypothetical protein